MPVPCVVQVSGQVTCENDRDAFRHILVIIFYLQKCYIKTICQKLTLLIMREELRLDLFQRSLAIFQPVEPSLNQERLKLFYMIELLKDQLVSHAIFVGSNIEGITTISI